MIAHLNMKWTVFRNDPFMWLYASFRGYLLDGVGPGFRRYRFGGFVCPQETIWNVNVMTTKRLVFTRGSAAILSDVVSSIRPLYYRKKQSVKKPNIDFHQEYTRRYWITRGSTQQELYHSNWRFTQSFFSEFWSSFRTQNHLTSQHLCFLALFSRKWFR